MSLSRAHNRLGCYRFTYFEISFYRISTETMVVVEIRFIEMSKSNGCTPPFYYVLYKGSCSWRAANTWAFLRLHNRLGIVIHLDFEISLTEFQRKPWLSLKFCLLNVHIRMDVHLSLLCLYGCVVNARHYVMPFVRVPSHGDVIDSISKFHWKITKIWFDVEIRTINVKTGGCNHQCHGYAHMAV